MAYSYGVRRFDSAHHSSPTRSSCELLWVGERWEVHAEGMELMKDVSALASDRDVDPRCKG